MYNLSAYQVYLSVNTDPTNNCQQVRQKSRKSTDYIYTPNVCGFG